ncbi:MAG: ATP-NAD kinase family protein [Halioglobus sp.]
MTNALKVGFFINPLAGAGGALAMKGSDSVALKDEVAKAGVLPSRSAERAQRALKALEPHAEQFEFLCWGGAMGEDALADTAIRYSVLGHAKTSPSEASDTQAAVETMLSAGAQIIVFAGGDGTARDIYDRVASRAPVLGIPAGVKMQSGVFAVSPESAAELLLQLASGGMVDVSPKEVRDIDESALQNDVVRSRFYGELLVPSEGHHLQRTKVGGKEDPELVAEEIAQWFVDTMDAQTLYLMGPGSTTATIMSTLGLGNTLIGVDAIADSELVATDCTEEELAKLVDRHTGPVKIVVTVIGGQGFIFGRGNQQFSPRVIRAVGLENIIVVAAKSKISELEGRTLLVDTNDPALDEALCGLRSVTTGYDDMTLCRVAC